MHGNGRLKKNVRNKGKKTMIDEEYVRNRIESELGRQLSNRVWDIVRQNLNQTTNIIYFVSLGRNPQCLACAKYPQHSPSVQVCTGCYRGKKSKDTTLETLENELLIYMEIIHPLLYAVDE